MTDLKIATTEFQPRFSETDALGIIWHGNFVDYFEMGRVEWAAQIFGANVVEIEETNRFAVKKFQMDLHSPAKFRDSLIMKTKLISLNKVSLIFHQEIFRSDVLVASAEVTEVSLSKTGELQVIHKELREKMKQYIYNDSQKT